MKTLIETSIEEGVPLPETCLQLNWKKPTKLWWVHEQKEDVFKVVTSSYKKTFKNLKLESENIIFIAPAPQMHEISPLLPIEIENIKVKKLGIITNIYQIFEIYGGGRIYYNGNDSYGNIITVAETEIKWYHYAQAYAELYLQLKAYL